MCKLFVVAALSAAAILAPARGHAGKARIPSAAVLALDFQYKNFFSMNTPTGGRTQQSEWLTREDGSVRGRRVQYFDGQKNVVATRLILHGARPNDRDTTTRFANGATLHERLRHTMRGAVLSVTARPAEGAAFRWVHSMKPDQTSTLRAWKLR